MWKSNKFNSFLHILTLLTLLCDVVWLSYGYSSGLLLNLKVAKAPIQIKIQNDIRTYITEDKIKTEWGL